MMTQNDLFVHPQIRRLVFFATFMVVLVKGLEVLVPMSHGDALYYHLPIAKLWLESGFYKMHQELCGSLQGGLYDYAYLLPVSIFGNTVIAQVMAQLMYYLFGVISILYIIVHKLKLTDINKCFAIILMMTFAVESDFFIYAKNDAILASLGFIASLEIFENYFSGSKDKLFLKGLLLGLLPLIKINGLLISGILGLYYILNTRNLKQICIVATTALIVCSPIFLRNFYFIKSPFFPALLTLFPGTLNEAIISFYKSAMTASLGWNSLLFHLRAFFAFKIIIVFVLILNFKTILKDKNLIRYFLLSCTIFVFYLLINGGVEASRFYFICYFLNSYIVLAIIKKINPKYALMILVVLLADSKVDKAFKRLKTVYNRAIDSKNLTEFTNKNIPLTNIWNYTSADTTILTDDFSQIFYAPKGTRVFAHQCNQEAYFLNNCDDISQLATFDYVILSKNKNTNNQCTDTIKATYNLLIEQNGYLLYQKL